VGSHEVSGSRVVSYTTEDGETATKTEFYSNTVTDYEDFPYYTWEILEEFRLEHYEFPKIKYKAKLSIVDAEIKPAETNFTWEKKLGKIYAKSGYGIQAVIKTRMQTSIYYERTGVTEDDNFTSIEGNGFATNAQRIYVYFPEFAFAKYNRFLEYDDRDREWKFKENEYSTYTSKWSNKREWSRVHFTPWWYPDDTKYYVAYKMMSCYTAGGIFSEYGLSTNDFIIQGSAFDDWYVAPVRD
jgi:hypothetical protein